MRARLSATRWVTAILLLAAPSFAQDVPWDAFTDNLSLSFCDVINASNAELVVLTDTAQLVIITGTDTILVDSFVDENNDVFIGDEPAGFIAYAEDGDGFRTLWWQSLTGRVVNVDGFSGVPSETDLFPIDFTNVPCDACDFWDDPSACAAPPDPAPPIVFNFCGLGSASAMILTGLTLFGMRFTRGRRG